MNDNELRAIVHAEIRQSLGWMSSNLTQDRIRALDYYFQKPFGNELEGRSQVVTSDVADTVEWILPSLLRIFTAGPEVVKFEPVGQEDEERAQQATDYVNHVFNRDNPGFLIMHTWFKDGLLQKNGIVKTWWEATTKPETRTYRNMDRAEALAVAKDPDVEIVERQDEGDKISLTTRRTRDYKAVKVAPVPPENFLISKNATSVEDAILVGEIIRKTASDLIKEGFSKAVVSKIPTGDDWMKTEEDQARSLYEDWARNYTDSPDKATRQVTEVECFIRVDYDEDGIAELRQIRIAGEQILFNEPVDDNPYADVTPIPMPHKWAGRSVADLVMDLQRVKSTLWRQSLDNLYLVNNSRTEVVQDQVNLDDLLTSRPGGIVRTKAPGMMREIAVPPVFQHALTMIEYVDATKEKRTGVTSYNQGLDANSLNKTATGIQNIIAQAQQRIEMIARIFAETGVRRLFKLIYGVISRNQQDARTVRMRGKWVDIDPTDWDSEMDCTVTVGLGTGSQDAQVARLMMILDIQKQAILMQGGWNGPLVTLNGIYNTLQALVEVQGLKSVERFFENPGENPAAAQPQPNGQQMMEQMKLQIDSEKNQIDMAKARGEFISKERTDALKAQELQLQHMQEMAKIAVQAKAHEQTGMVEAAKLTDASQARQHERQGQVIDLAAQRQAAGEERTATRQAAVEDRNASQAHDVKMKNADRVAEGQPVIDHEAEMQKIADAIVAAGNQQVAALQAMVQGIVANQQAQTQAIVSALLAPTELVRDAQGKPVGARKVAA